MIYQITATDTANILITAGGVVGDFMPLIIIFVGIAVAFAIWEAITHRK